MSKILVQFESTAPKRYVASVLLLLGLGSYFYIACTFAYTEQEYSETIKAIARDIAGLKSEFPQLKNFSLTENIELENLSIEYEFHTHPSKHRGGWTSGVPNPDDDGIWFYIDFHEPGSKAQIHTQPVIPKMCVQDKNVSFLILEEDKTESVSNRIQSILKSHGVKPCK
jgi:hypothetical protein